MSEETGQTRVDDDRHTLGAGLVSPLPKITSSHKLIQSGRRRKTMENRLFVSYDITYAWLIKKLIDFMALSIRKSISKQKKVNGTYQVLNCGQFLGLYLIQTISVLMQRNSSKGLGMSSSQTDPG